MGLRSAVMIRPRTTTLLMLASLVIPLAYPTTARAADVAPGRPTLYERLGGAPALTAVVDETIRRGGTDPRINAKLVNADLARLRTHLIEQLCVATGGPCRYTGRDMKTAHRGLSITGAEFDALVEDMRQAMTFYKVPAREQDEVVGLLAPTKPDIVQPATAAPAARGMLSASRPAAAATAPAPAVATVPGASKTAPPTGVTPVPVPAADPVSERAEGLREAAGLLNKADAERKRGNRSLADQLFSFAELIVGPDALAALAPLFREGAPPRVTSATTAVPTSTPPQPLTAGNSEEEDPPPRPARGSLTGSVKVGANDFEGLAVITLEPTTGRFRRRPPRQRVVEQRNRQFAPRMLVVPTGSTVGFPNFDSVYHNVFSRSEVRPFDLGLYKAGQEREIRFEKEGIVRIGCNLHANMSAVIVVVSAPHYVITDPHGRFAFRSVEPGTYKMRTYTDGEDGPTIQTVTIAPTQNTANVVLQAAPRVAASTDKFGLPRAQKTSH
jgi:hemoglobin